MSDYLERKKKEREEREALRKNDSTNAGRKTAAGMGNNNINGETLSEWRARQKTGVKYTQNNDSGIRNVYGQTPEEYRKMISSGQSLSDYDKWKGTSEQLLREYDKYSHSGKYQSKESYQSYAKRIETQLKNTVKLKEKNEDKVSEIDDIIQRLSEASGDNDEGYKYFSESENWGDEESYNEYQESLKKAEAEANKKAAMRKKDEKNAKQIAAKEVKYSVPENTLGSRSYQSTQSAKDKEAAQEEVEKINESGNLWQYGVNGLNPMGSQAGADYTKNNQNSTDGQKAIVTKAVNDKKYSDQLEKYEQEQQDITEKAAQAVNDPDFESKSQYRKSGWTWKGIIPYSSDPDYEYINDADGTYRDTLNHKEGNGIDEFGSEQARKGYDYIEDDEVKVYNYIYETEGRKEAEQYLESLNLTQRMTETKTKEASESADKHPVIESLKTIPKNIFHAGQGYVGDLVDKAQGKPIDTNSYANLSMNESNATRNTVTEGIGNPVGQFAYQTAMSMGDFLGTAAVSGVLSQTGVLGELAKFGITEKRLSGFIMGSNAATQGVLEAKERGLSDDQALMTGLAQGIAEEVFEEYSLEKLKVMAATDPKTPKNVFVNVAKQAFTEGSEEFFTDMANAFTDLIINSDESENMQKRQAYIDAGYSEWEADKMTFLDYTKQLGLSFAGGAVSGGVMGGLASGIAYNFNKANIEENVEVEENLQETKEDSQEDNEVMPWEEAAKTEENATEEKHEEEVPWEEYEETDPEAYFGQTVENGTDTTENRTKKTEVAPVQRKNSMAQIVNTVLTHGEVNDTVAAEIASNADLKNAFEERTGVTLSGNKEQQANAVKEIVRLTAERNDSRRAETTEGKITEVVFEQGQDTKFKDDAGNTYTYQEAIQKNPEMTDAYVDATRVAIENGTQAAKVFLENYSTSYPVEIYNNGFKMMYNAGRNGIPFEVSVEAASYVKDTIGQTVMKKAWDLGMNAKREENSKAEVKIKKQKRKGTGTYENQTVERSGGLPELERLVANRTGIDITRKSGLDHNANGSFTASTMTMLLNDNAQNEYTALIHELGEFGLAYDRTGMKEVQQMLVKYWTEKSGITGLGEIDSMVEEYQRRYKAVEGSKTRAEAMDEIINDALGGLFSTDEGIKEFTDWLKTDSGYTKGEQRTIVQRFVDALDSIVKYLKEKIKDMSLSKAARKALELDKQQAENVRKQFLEVLDNAVEEANTTGEYTSDTDVKYHISDKFSEEIDKALRGELNESEQVKARDYTPKILVEKGVKDLPMLITQKHVKTIIYTEAEAKQKRIKVNKNDNYHGLGKELLLKVIDNMDDPEEIYKINDENYIVVTKFKDADGKEIIVPVKIDGSGNYNGLYIDENQIKSAYGKKNLKRYLQKKGFEKIYEKKGTTLNEGVQYPDISDSSNKIITDNSEKASAEFSLPEEYDRVRRENETLLRENETFKQIIDSLEHTLDIKEGIKLNEQSIEKAAKNMLKKYKSNVDQKSFVENVTALFQAAAKNEMSVSDFEYLAESIIRPLIEQSENNLQISDYAKDVLSDIKKTAIKLDGTQKKESAYHYGSYGNLRKSLFGRANFSENGTQLDTLWQQWAETYPDLFDADISPVDQPVKLAEIIKSLKEDYVNEYGFDIDDAVSYAAAELLNEYASIPEVENLLDAKKKSEFRVRYRELTNMIKKDYQQRYEGQIKELKQKNAERISKMSAQNRDRLLRQEAKYRSRMAETRNARLERQDRAKYKNSIVKNTKSLLNMLEKNNEKYHVPENLKNITVEFLSTLDFLKDEPSGRYRGIEAGGQWGSREMVQLQLRLNEIYRGFENEINGEGNLAQDIDPDFLPTMNELLGRLRKNMDAKKIAEMDVQELGNVAFLVDSLKRAINNQNQLLENKKYEQISEVGDRTILELSQKKRKEKSGMLDNLLNMDMLDSASFFSELGEGAESIYQEIRDAQDKRIWLLRKAEDYMKKVREGKDVKKWTGKDAEVIEYEFRGEKYEITVGQLINLYMASKREQGRRHLFGEEGGVSQNGGFMLEERSLVKDQRTPDANVRMSEEEMNQLFEKLTPDQKEVAEKMGAFMSGPCAQWGNETTMKMYGSKKFVEKNYWTLKTNEDYRQTNDGNAGDNTSLYAIKNMGATKNIDKNARNPLIIGDAFDLFAEHVTAMATYSAYCIPLSDAMKWYNYRSVSEDGKITGTVKEQMNRAYGSNAKKYFVNFIKDVNGEAKKGISSEISDTFTSKYKAAAVGGNLRVVIQQPTAYMRASAEIDVGYLTRAMLQKPAVKEMQENSAIAIWKSWGYFETGLGQSMKKTITGTGTFMENLVEKSMWAAGTADDITWGTLWNAVKLEVADKNKDIDTDSEEYMKLVNRRFNEVIDKTQVVDSVLHRSQIMRSKDGAVKMATAFMAEPTKTYNLLRNAMLYGDTKTKVRTVAACTATAVVTAAVASVADAFRDDDEEKAWGEKWVENFKANTIDGINPLNNIPYVKEITSFMDGYDSERMDMAGVSSLITGIQQAYKYAKGDSKKTLYGVLKSLARGISQVSGVPAYNVLRELETLANQFVDIDTNKPTGSTVRIRLLNAMKNNNETQIKKWLEWYDEEYQKKIDAGKTSKEAMSAMKSSIANQYKEIYQKSTTADKIKIKQLLLRIRVGNRQLFNGYDWSSWDKAEKKTKEDD